MKVSNVFGHITFVVLCGLLTVLATDTQNSVTRHQPQEQMQSQSLHMQQHPRQNQHYNHNSNHHQRQQHHHQQQQQSHHNHHQHPHYPHQQPQLQSSHATKQKHHPTSTTSSTLYSTPRQPRKLETKSLTSQVELIDVKNIPKNHNNNTTTKLRRLNEDDVYNRALQRRLNARRSAPRDEWAYNTYNIHTNTFGSALPSNHASGKGDDNSDDVEFVSATGSRLHPDWSRRGGYTPPRRTTTTTTLPPPALVPARRGYPMAAPTTDAPVTEDPFETNTISRNPTNSGMDPRDMEKRHICVQQRTITMPVKTTEVYTRPIWKHVSTPCQPQTHTNQMCTRVQLVHEQAYRDVVRHKSAQQVTYDCCTGWMRETPHADGCMKPICGARCQNGGTCLGPDTCSCPAGFTGRYCEHDINECKEEKPCDQTCINTVGSYQCRCREGFTLQADQQSCKKNDLHHDDAFEARDLENEIETQEDITARLQKIEKQLANERVQSNELQKTLQSTYTMVDSLKNRLVNLEKQQLDYNRMQSNMYSTETRTMKLEGMVNLLMKCRNTVGPNAQCP